MMEVQPKRWQEQEVIKHLSNRHETLVRQQPLNKSSFNGNASEQIRIRIPASGTVIDFSRAYLSCRVTYQSATNTDWVRLTRDAPLFNRVIVVAENGGMEIENISEYDDLYKAMAKWTVTDDSAKSQRQLLKNSKPVPSAGVQAGAGDYTQGANSQYINFTHNLGFLGTALYPSALGGSLLLQFDLNPAYKVIEAHADTVNTVPAGALSYTLDRVEFVYPVIQYDDLDDVLKERRDSEEGLVIRYDTFQSYNDDTVSTNVTTRIALQSQYLKGLYTVFKDGAKNGALANPWNQNEAHAYDFVSDCDDNTTFQYKFGNQYMPSFVGNVRQHAFSETLRAMGHMLTDISQGNDIESQADFESRSFVLGVSMEENDGSLSGFNTNGVMEVVLNYNGRTTANAREIHHYAHVDRLLIVGRDGVNVVR